MDETLHVDQLNIVLFNIFNSPTLHKTQSFSKSLHRPIRLSRCREQFVSGTNTFQVADERGRYALASMIRMDCDHA